MPKDVQRITRHVRTSAAAATRRRADGGPYRRILAAIEDSAASKWVLPWARALARSAGAKILLANVGTGADIAGQADLLRRRARSLLRDGYVPKLLATEGGPASGLANLAAAERADVVVLGSHSRSRLQRLIEGSVGEKVLDQVDCDVLIARSAPTTPSVLIATDPTAAGKRAARQGLRVAAALGANARLLHVIPPAFGFRPNATAPGHRADHIVAAARAGRCKLVVVGTRHHRGLRRLVVGSVSRGVIHRQGFSALIVQGRGRRAKAKAGR